ncbi:unnamed protein product [Acanthoscelides obtectus]|uniref:C2H2-type domain-containing protein n=1 Tax=Acanthoscelides obtectus TaxID=200917 RepID=A0A9P0LB43_ACAOB|nr:unnamed protein product [Acanthoscelides obtectus]CAK1620009.1 hypothetical protein AOBTE_LOCUS130 [Acanthoscelides obtectus]
MLRFELFINSPYSLNLINKHRSIFRSQLSRNNGRCIMWNGVKMEPTELGAGEVKTEATEDDSNICGTDLNYKDFKVELGNGEIKVETTENYSSMGRADLHYKDGAEVKAEAIEVDSVMCSADFEYKDVKVEFDDGDFEAKTTEDVSNVCGADFGYKDVKVELDDGTVKAEDDSNVCSAEYKNFHIMHEDLEIKDDDGESSEAVKSDLNRRRPGGEHLLNRSSDTSTCNEQFITTANLDDRKTKKDSDLLQLLGKYTKSRKLCIQCNETFTNCLNLDEHIIRKHPEYLSCVSRKIHKCTDCTYLTAIKGNLRRHMLKHELYPVKKKNDKMSTC